MRKWMFVCAVVTVAGFMAEPALAQAPIQAPTTVITSEAPRGGLFRRMRERRQGTTVSQVTATAPAPIQQAQAIQTPMATTAQTQVVETRGGLLSRLRMRR